MTGKIPHDAVIHITGGGLYIELPPDKQITTFGTDYSAKGFINGPALSCAVTELREFIDANRAPKPKPTFGDLKPGTVFETTINEQYAKYQKLAGSKNCTAVRLVRLNEYMPAYELAYMDEDFTNFTIISEPDDGN